MTATWQNKATVVGFQAYTAGANEICALLRFYAAWNDCFFPTFRDNLSAPSSKIKHFKKNGLLDLRRWDLQIVPKRW